MTFYSRLKFAMSVEIRNQRRAYRHRQWFNGMLIRGMVDTGAQYRALLRSSDHWRSELFITMTLTINHFSGVS